MRLRLGGSSVIAALVLALASGQAFALEFVIPPAIDDAAHQCHNPHTGGGGYQIDFDGLGLDTGNPHGALHINSPTLSFSTIEWNLGSLVKPPTGNTIQTTDTLTLQSGEGATFRVGGQVVTNVLGVELLNDNDVTFRGIQLRPLGQEFTLNIFTTGGTFTFLMESIMGSQVNFNHNGIATAVNLRFCATLVRIPPPPPPIPEPTSLFALGLAGVAFVRKAREKLLPAR